jgi:hypothetical protein
MTAQNLADLGHFVSEVSPPSQDPVDEIPKNTGRMDGAGNFWLSCDIKEA